MKPIVPVNQDQLVKQKLNMSELKVRTDITERISVPGIDNLHLKSSEEIAKVLANVIKSRIAIKAITYRVGEYIEITSESDIKV